MEYVDDHGDEAHDTNGFMNNKCSSKVCPDECSMDWKIFQTIQQKQSPNSSLNGQYWIENDTFEIICKGLSLYMINYCHLHLYFPYKVSSIVIITL